MTDNNSTFFYAVANNLKGFAVSTLRVKVTRIEGEYAWVVTADLLDAGTSLVLNTSQIEPEQAEALVSFESGLVVFPISESERFEILNRLHEQERQRIIAEEGSIDALKAYPYLDQLALQMFRILSGGKETLEISAEFILEHAERIE